MTSTDLVRQDSYASATLAEKRAYVEAIAQAGDLLPSALMSKPTMDPNTRQMIPARVQPGKVLLLAETGAMLGIHPMAALQGIFIIEGKPSLSANLLGALVRRAGHKLRVTTTGTWADGSFIARAVLIRSDDPDFEFVVEWNRMRAKQAGLDGKGNWSKYPEAMAKARAITEVIREGAPDVTLVAAYTPEELGAKVEGAEGDVVEMSARREQKPQAPVVAEPGATVTQGASDPRAATQAASEEAAEVAKPAPKKRATRKPKAEPDHAKEDAEAKARVEANRKARAEENATQADPATGEVQEAEVDPEPTSDDTVKEDPNVVDAEEVPDDDTDWEALLEEATEIGQVRDLYTEAREKGLLGLEITWAGEQRALGAVITEVGQAFAALSSEG